MAPLWENVDQFDLPVIAARREIVIRLTTAASNANDLISSDNQTKEPGLTVEGCFDATKGRRGMR